MLKIEDGCDAFCSYCIVPYARGVPRSVAFGDVGGQARLLVEAGVREIVLTGINIGRYSDGGHDIVDVVAAVAESGVERLRLSSIEPQDVNDRLLALLAQTPAACRHLHVPLQSGSDEVLGRMRRGYTIADYEARIASARTALPGLAVTTDVIAGFPEETEAQARETLDAVERIGFAKLHVFRYSQRPGTPAATMLQVPPEVRSARAATLREAGERLRRRFVESRLGEESDVLVERLTVDGAGDESVAEGTTADYLKVRFPVPRSLKVAVGNLRTVRLISAAGDVVLGTSA
jgi:threonylcarbamoyladenosine tRNA methylthiotransferase MtaB